MRIAYIQTNFMLHGDAKFTIKFLEVTEESEERYYVKDHEDGIEPRSNFLSKEIDENLASMGYASLNLPCWITAKPYELSGVIYVLENDIEKGKELLKEAIVNSIDTSVERYNTLKSKLLQMK